MYYARILYLITTNKGGVCANISGCMYVWLSIYVCQCMCVRACVRACVCVCVRACVFYNNNSLRSSSFSKMRSFWHVSPNLNLLIHIIATAIKWLTVLNSEAHRFFWCKLINKAIFSVMSTVLLVLHLISLSTSFQTALLMCTRRINCSTFLFLFLVFVTWITCTAFVRICECHLVEKNVGRVYIMQYLPL